MDYIPGIATLGLLVGVSMFIVLSDLSLLDAISCTFMGTSIISLALMIVIEARTGWNDDMLAPFAFLEALTLIAICFRNLVEKHDATRRLLEHEHDLHNRHARNA